jgi:hypothetical protein
MSKLKIDPNNPELNIETGHTFNIGQDIFLEKDWDNKVPCPKPNNKQVTSDPPVKDNIKRAMEDNIKTDYDANYPTPTRPFVENKKNKGRGNIGKDCREDLFNKPEYEDKYQTQTDFDREFLYNKNGFFKDKHYINCRAPVIRELWWKLRIANKNNWQDLDSVDVEYDRLKKEKENSEKKSTKNIQHTPGPLSELGGRSDFNGIPIQKKDVIYVGNKDYLSWKNNRKDWYGEYNGMGVLQYQEEYRKILTQQGLLDKEQEQEQEKEQEKEQENDKYVKPEELEDEVKENDKYKKENDNMYNNIDYDKNIPINSKKIPFFKVKTEDILLETDYSTYNEYLNALEKKSYKYNQENDEDLEFLYPDLDDPNFSLKIAKRQEFNENKYQQDIVDVKTQSNLLCDSDFDLMPHQNFVKNFVSSDTPYKGLLLYHGVGTGKTCSAIGIAEENRKKGMNYNSEVKLQTIIIASPNVQDNFKQQLFDKKKLDISNNIFTLNTCVGNDLIKEVNPNDSEISEKQLVKQINNIITTNYNFMGYTQFGLWAKSLISVDNDTGYEKEQIKRIEINRIKKYFNNRLIIIDEVHNIRIVDDNSQQKFTTNILMKIAKYTDNMKLILLSATPMYNSYKEIIWITNLLNINDNRSSIRISDVFDTDGNFIKNDDPDTEDGDELLKRKLIGYVSYLRGENPYSFPFRIYPDEFSPDNIYKSDDKPSLQLNKVAIDPSMNLPLYMVSLDTYQEKSYNVIIRDLNNNTDESKMPNFENLDAFGYNLLQKPLEALNMVYPKPELDELFSSDIDNMNKNVLRRYISVSETDKNIDIVGKSGLRRIMNFETTTIKFNYEYKPEILSRYGRIFSKENIGKYSSKISSICNNIMNSTGIIIVYSQYIEGGVIPIALALEERGFTRFSTSNNVQPLLKDPPVEALDAIHMKPKSEFSKNSFNRARYVLITGDSNFSQSNAEDMKFITNKNNADGSKVKVVIISKAASEGLDFANVRQVHILEPWYNLNRIEQIIGRGVRNLSHCRLPFENRNVELYLYSFKPIVRDKHKYETADMYVYRLAEKKSKLIGNVTRLLKENSIDCYLNIAQTNLSMEKFKELSENSEVDINLSSGKKIKYTIGDRPFSSVCDYMDNCNYSCPTNDKVDEDNLISSSYNDTFVTSNYNAIVKRIKAIFSETPFIKQDEFIKQINAKTKYTEQQILYVVTLFINNQRVVDNIGRKGYIINYGDYYIFQPSEISDLHATTYERTNRIDYKDRKIIIERPTNMSFTQENTNPFSQENKTYKDLIEEVKGHIINSWNGKRKSVAQEIPANSDWFVEIEAQLIKTFLKDNHNFPENIFKKYVVYHYLDVQDINDRETLLNGIHNQSEDTINIIESQSEPTQEKEAREKAIEFITDYFEKKKLDDFVILLDGNSLKYYKNTGNSYQLITNEIDKADVNRIIYKKYYKNLTKQNMNNVVGFMHPFKSDNITFKLKDIYTQYNNKGSVCKNLSKEDTIKKLNCLINTSKCEINPKPDPFYDESDNKHLYTEQNIKLLKESLRKTGLCIITEFLYRWYDEQKIRGLRYFFDPEESFIHQITLLK